MRKRISRRGIYQKLDRTIGPAEKWLDDKRLLDAEFLAEESEASIVVGHDPEDDIEDLEEYLQRKFG